VFDRVVIVTPRDTVAQDIPTVVRQGILRRLRERRITLITLSELRWSADFESNARLDCVDVFNGDVTSIDDVAFLAWSTPRAPDPGLAYELAASGIAHRLIGDALAARPLLAATSEGHAAGMAV
jgi:hypothetical protein